MSSTRQTDLPVAVIGAGPIGLAAAAHLVACGDTPLVFEAGATAGASVLKWGHVRMFSPWQYNIDAVAGELLAAHDWSAPNPDELPTGQELVERYLAPLAALPEIAPHLRFNTRVLAVTRQSVDKMKSAGRAEIPFLLHVESADGVEEHVLARAVIDASGTYESPNFLGVNGIPALGERSLAGQIFYGIPDVRGRERARYAGRSVAVAGSGHSAFNALLDLAELAKDEPGTSIRWIVRRANLRQLFGGEDQDELPARGGLGIRLRQQVESGVITLVTNFRTIEVRRVGAQAALVGTERTIDPVDQIIVTTGFRPDLTPLRELRLELDPACESPVALAATIDPNLHSCGSVPPHGAAELQHPEPDFYIVGMKSYGRAPTFLMLTGYEQVRSIVCALTGDLEGAKAVRLELPETGVCTVDACCEPAASSAIPLQLTLPSSARSSCCEPSADVADEIASVER